VGAVPNCVRSTGSAPLFDAYSSWRHLLSGLPARRGHRGLLRPPASRSRRLQQRLAGGLARGQLPSGTPACCFATPLFGQQNA
jgi:hypothetical protein